VCECALRQDNSHALCAFASPCAVFNYESPSQAQFPAFCHANFSKIDDGEKFLLMRERCACVCNNQRMTEFSAARSAHVVQRHSKNYHFCAQKSGGRRVFHPPHTTHTHLICVGENNTNGVSSEVAGRMSSCLSCIT
jgi:hypothetical protein